MNLLKIEEVIKPLLEQSGYQLYDLDFQGRTLRVTIHKDGGVTIEDCVDATRLLNPVLDVDDVIPGGRYELEVSSPGLDRALKRADHFKSAIGEVIHVVTSQSVEEWNEKLDENDKFFVKRKKVKGELKKIEDEVITVECDTRDVKIPLKIITRSYVDFELVKQEKKK